MIDQVIPVDPGLSLADQAVDYMLERIRRDVDLRWLMLDTEAWAKLCEAHSARTGRPLEDVREESRKLYPHCANDKPRIPEMRRQIAALEEQANKSASKSQEKQSSWGRKMVREVMDLCPNCDGIPRDSINRCPMCRRLQRATM
jgi:predicted RNA-binding Zn-ribbon protein involved in translation (DUF1610 family)